MNIVIHHIQNEVEDSLTNFRNLYFNGQMKYFASDLLQEGLSPTAIRDAVQKAIRICNISDLEVRAHFQPVYTEMKGTIIKDCKLSQLGYGLVMLNAEETLPIVAQWQLKVVKNFLD
jgi:hypothetical protein